MKHQFATVAMYLFHRCISTCLFLFHDLPGLIGVPKWMVNDKKETDICGPPGLEFWPHAIPIYIHVQCQELRQDTATWSNTFHSNYQNESARSQGDRIWCVPGSVQNLQWLLICRFIIVQIYPSTFIEPILRARCSHAACSMLRNSLTIGSPVW
jgi:hypothetical protein